MDTEGISDAEGIMIANYIVMILKKLRQDYKISSETVH